jgi:hypothetical protein
MSETIEIVAPAVQRAGLGDLTTVAPWLLPRIVEHWKTTEHQAMLWLRGSLPSNEQALMVCGDAIGMAHVEPGRLGRGPRVVVDFVLCARQEIQLIECEEIFAWFARWARGMGAVGLFGVDDFCDIDRSWIRGKIGRLTKHESVSLIF